MQKYTKTAILLHWLMALLIGATFALGLTMVEIHGVTPTKLQYFSWHKWLGVTILGLACVRLLWRLTHATPAYPNIMPEWQKKIAGLLHGFLYAMFFSVPLAGYFYSLAAGVPVVYLGIFPLPVMMAPNPELKPILKELHEALSWLLMSGTSLHVLAALKHHFIDHDDVIKRIIP